MTIKPENNKTKARGLERLRGEPIRDRDELAAVVILAAQATIDRDRLALERDEAVAAIQEDFNLRLEALEGRIERDVARMRAWATRHREEFGEARHITVAGHELAWRKSPGAVAYLPGWKAGDALEAVLNAEDEAVAGTYTKVSASLDKNAVLRAWREGPGQRELLLSMGIEVVEPEEFKFIPNRDGAEAVTLKS